MVVRTIYNDKYDIQIQDGKSLVKFKYDLFDEFLESLIQQCVEMLDLNHYCKESFAQIWV